MDTLGLLLNRRGFTPKLLHPASIFLKNNPVGSNPLRRFLNRISDIFEFQNDYYIEGS